MIEAKIGRKGAFAPLFRDYQRLFQATNPKATKADIRKSAEASSKKLKDKEKDKKKSAKNVVEEKNVGEKESRGVEEGEEMRIAKGESFEASGERQVEVQGVAQDGQKTEEEVEKVEEVNFFEEVGIPPRKKKKKKKLVHADSLEVGVKNDKEKVMMEVEEGGREVGGVTRKKKRSTQMDSNKSYLWDARFRMVQHPVHDHPVNIVLLHRHPNN